jgi:DNA-binding transcriptional regulator GbsR (MarR family)
VRDPGGGREWRRSFVEDFGDLDLLPDTPRASMRVLGFMVVCRPAAQSAQQIMGELGLSAGSVSSAVNALHGDGLLERVTRPGDRRGYYLLSAQGWESVLEARFRGVGDVRRAADKALRASRGEADYRLCALREIYARVEAAMVDLLAQSRAERARADGASATPQNG